ncbi:DUF2378 family protein [Pyxidicoccus trucidator]|uniref:DUF2378 family protein n=1 Tax=Pyxidicoccus trucidator TaxID=2709662 RepID=UPI0013DC2F75|nr:DUF2378 family protein [Pyxidicoccus trucidator]
METVMAQPAGREPVVFGHALETLLAAAAPLTSDTLAALERIGVSALRPLNAAYPYAMWPQAIHLLAGATFMPARTEEAEYALGQRFIVHARHSKLGAAMDDLARVVGAERMLLRMSHNLRTTTNVLEAGVTPRSEDTGWELLLRPVAEFARAPGLPTEPPHFIRGLLTAALQRAGAPAARVEVLRHDAARATTTFHVTL